MKRLIIIFNIIFLLSSCKQNAQTIPQEINNEGKTNFDIPNTKLSINKPAEYTFYSEISRIQLAENKFIQFSEMDGANFIDGKKKFLSGIEAKEKQGGKINTKQNLKVGNYEGVFIIAPQNAKQITQTILIFGDESFTTMIAGITPINDENAQKEIQKIILSVNYDKTKFIDLEKQIPFSINLKNSNYKLTKIISGIAFYTINGKGTPFGDTLVDNFFVQIFPRKLSQNEMEKYSEKFVADLKNNSYPEKNVTIKKQTSNKYFTEGNDILETILVNDYQGKENRMILILKATEKGTILFSGTDLTANNITLLKEIMNSIKIK